MNRISKLAGLSILSLSVVVGGALPKPVKAKAAPARPQALGAGANYCINATNNPDGFSYFTNTCGGDVTIVVAHQHGVWAPSLLGTGAYVAHYTANGPFRYFTCDGSYVPHDALNQTEFPGFNSNYVCKPY